MKNNENHSLLYQLSPIESYRAIAIIEETIEKLLFLETITPDILQHREEFSQLVGDEISQIIQEQKELEKKYEKLVSQRNDLKGLSNKSSYKENQKEIQHISHLLKESTRNLCRNLKNNPNFGGNLLKIQIERQNIIDILTDAINELKIGSFEKLVKKINDGKELQDKVQEIIQREKETIEEVKNLEQEFLREKSDHQRQVQEHKNTISSLKQQLIQIKSKAHIDVKYAKKEAQAKIETTTRLYNQTLKENEEKISLLQKSYDTENIVHKEVITFLQEKQEELLNECKEWEGKYQLSYNEKEKELSDLIMERENNLNKLSILQKRYEDDMAENKEKEMERIRLLELEEIRKEEIIKQNNAAKVIQISAKSYLAKIKVIKTLLNENSKSKKKKGSKKDKK